MSSRYLQLVIEPLRALIESQVSELKRRGVCVEKLLPYKDVINNDDIAARDRLDHILEIIRIKDNNEEPRILFMTPELFQVVQMKVKEFVQRRLISLIVIDEFDEIQNAKLSFREAYLKLLPDLRITAPNVQLFLLSATITRKLIFQLRTTCPKNILPMPHIYRTNSPLPTNHIYRGKLLFFCLPIYRHFLYFVTSIPCFLVEKKVNNKQIVDDIVKEIKKDMCLCYCLTRATCEKMKVLFLNLNIKADYYHARADREHNKTVLENFKRGKLQVLCATKALGRGIHLEKCPIRFVIHTMVPLSLPGKKGRVFLTLLHS